MPIRHVVMFTWAEGVDDEHVATVSAALDGLPAAVPSIKQYVHGPDLGLSEGNFDYAVVADFDDEAGYVAYRDDATHQQLIADHIKPFITARAAVQHAV